MDALESAPTETRPDKEPRRHHRFKVWWFYGSLSLFTLLLINHFRWVTDLSVTFAYTSLNDLVFTVCLMLPMSAVFVGIPFAMREVRVAVGLVLWPIAVLCYLLEIIFILTDLRPALSQLNRPADHVHSGRVQMITVGAHHVVAYPFVGGPIEEPSVPVFQECTLPGGVILSRWLYTSDNDSATVAIAAVDSDHVRLDDTTVTLGALGGSFCR